MAIFSYRCPDHGDFRVSLNKRSSAFYCPDCGKESKPIIKSATFQVVERLDNGAMARRVERLHNVEDIMNDRADKDSKRNKEKRGLDE